MVFSRGKRKWYDQGKSFSHHPGPGLVDLGLEPALPASVQPAASRQDPPVGSIRPRVEEDGKQGPLCTPTLGRNLLLSPINSVAAAPPCHRILGSFGQQQLLVCRSSDAHRDNSYGPWGPPAQTAPLRFHNPSPLPPAPQPDDPSRSVTTSKSRGSLWTHSGTPRKPLCA